MSEKVNVKQFSISTKQKIIFEEWITSEFETIAKNSDDATWLLDQISFKPCNGLVLREPQKESLKPNISFVEYVKSDFDNLDQVYVVFSIPMFRLLDNRTLVIVLRIIRDSLVLYKKYNSEKTFDECEIEAIERYRREVTFVDRKSLDNFVASQKKVFSTLKTLHESGLQIIDPRMIVKQSRIKMKNDIRLKKIFNRVKARWINSSKIKIIRDVKIRPFPALFSYVDRDIGKRYVTPVQSMMIYDQTNSYSFSIILVSDQLLDAQEISDSEIEILLAHEIVNLLSQRKFSRGDMEQEIFNFISSKKNPTVEEVMRMYTKQVVENAREKILNVTRGVFSTDQSLVQVS